MEAKVATLLERQDIPKDVKFILKELKNSYKSCTREIEKIKRQFKELTEEFPLGILEVDVVKKQLISVNNIICERTGYVKEELLSLNLFDLLPEEIKDYFTKGKILLLSGEDITPRYVEFRIRKKDGNLFWVSAKTKFAFNSQGDVEKATMVLFDIDDQKKAEIDLKENKKKYRILSESTPNLVALVDLSSHLSTFKEKPSPLSIVRDIAERKAAEIALQEAKEKYQMLIEKMEEGVVLEDARGFFTFVNPQTVTLLGYTEEELLNKHWSNFVAPECLEMVKSETNKRPEGVSSRYETLALRKNGQRIPLIITATPLHSKKGDFEGVLSVFTDISKLKKTEQKLRESETRIQKIKLEEEHYHAMSSHFLNNDLQKILFSLDLLLHKYNYSKELDQEIIKLIIKIVYHSSRKIELVNKIFAVLQSELPHKTEKLNVLELINGTVEKFTSLSHLKIIEVDESTLSSIELEADNYLYDALYELLFFGLSSSYNELDTKKAELPVLIKASLISSNFCISIRDNYSQPISQLISTQITSPITEKWESRGHYLPIALVSVIMKRYDGTLKITPLDPKGNEFQLLFPLKLVQHSFSSI